MNSFEDIINKDGYIIYKFKGISMLPLLDEKKELIKIEKINAPLKKYDIVLFKRNNNSYVLHRIINIKDDIYDIVGDNQIFIEEVKRNQIIGIATGKIRDGEFVPFKGKEYDDYVNDICKDIYARKKTIRINTLRDEYVELLELFISTINNEKYSIKGNGEAILNLTKSQHIQAFCFYGLDIESIDNNLYTKWLNETNTVLRKDILYETQRKVIYKEFEENHIKYVPLKGIVIRDFYPRVGVRPFSDNDILFEKDKSKEVDAIMQKLGFDPILVSDYNNENTYHKDNYYSFEMHKKLFEDVYGDSNNYFIDIFDRVIKDGNSEYAYHMSDLDFYLYFLAHMAKHHISSGAGLRFYSDLYYINKELLPRINKNDLNRELKKLNLLDFYDETMTFLNQLLNRDYSDADRINYILRGNVYGSIDNTVVNSIKKKGKLKYLFSLVFLPLNNMRIMFPILEKLPILLPLFWIIRIFRNLFSREHRKRTVAYVEAMKRNKETS